MRVIVKKFGFEILVSQDPENPDHFYMFEENGRLGSDYMRDDLIFLDDDDIQENA